MCSLTESSRSRQVKAISKTIRVCTGHLPTFEQVWPHADDGLILVVRYAIRTLRGGMITQVRRGVLCDKAAQ
jgi:hypothetical protein